MDNKVSFTTTKKNWIIISTIMAIILVIVLAYNPIKNKLNPTLELKEVINTLEDNLNITITYIEICENENDGACFIELQYKQDNEFITNTCITPYRRLDKSTLEYIENMIFTKLENKGEWQEWKQD